MESLNKRIESIDALRAFALLGILIVHTSQLFNFNNDYNCLSYFTILGDDLISFISHYFKNRFVILFSILFGTSFYLILNNPQYTRKKFCWRCILLILFGLVNKIVYTTDILIWYGVNGIILSIIPLNKISAKYILVIAVSAYILSFQSFINIGNIVSPDFEYTYRYQTINGIMGILSYPYCEVLMEDIHIFGGLGSLTLSFFIFGYYLGKSGIINKIDKICNLKMISIFALFYIISTFLYKYTGYLPNIKKICDLLAALLYAITFIFIYNKLSVYISFMTFYGKLGLTNYSIQNLIIPIIISIILSHTRWSFEYILIISILFYTLQVIFSTIWLKKYKYGPLEYLWRILTNLKYISNH